MRPNNQLHLTAAASQCSRVQCLTSRRSSLTLAFAEEDERKPECNMADEMVPNPDHTLPGEPPSKPVLGLSQNALSPASSPPAARSEEATASEPAKSATLSVCPRHSQEPHDTADKQAHRAKVILIFGILSAVVPYCMLMLPFSWKEVLILAMVSAAAGGPLGITVCIMGWKDLAAMRAGRMDRSGARQTRIGLILGILGIWNFVGLLVGIYPVFLLGPNPLR